MKTWLLATAMFAATPAAAQTLDVIGPAGQHAVITARELAAMAHVKVSVDQHGQAHTYEGVPLGDLVAGVGAPQGEAIRGRELATVIRVTAADGYQVVLGLAETDPGMRRGRVLVADREAGKPLPAKDGPFRLVFEDDLKPARSARRIEVIEVLPLFQEPPR